MNWVGANSFRTSHYPYAEEMLDYADRSGFLVISETPLVGLSRRLYTPAITQRAQDLISRLIERDYNHPSVIMWSLANEPNDCNTPEADKFFKALVDTARKNDSNRPLTYAAHRLAKDNNPVHYFDICCINKYFGWYESPGEIDSSLPQFAACIENFANEFDKPIILAEFGADAVAGMHFHPAQMFSEEYQAEIIEKQYTELRKNKFVIGAHVWAFADFKTAQATTRVILNRKGFFSRDRQPKLAAHMLKKLWSTVADVETAPPC